MFEIIETRKVLNITCYKVRTSKSVEWYYFKNIRSFTTGEIKLIHVRQFQHLRFYKNIKAVILPIVAFNDEDWKDFHKIESTLERLD